MIDLRTQHTEPHRRSSLEPETDSHHHLTSVISGSTETISGLIDTRHEVHEIPPDPRAFDKPRRTPTSTSRPLPAPPPELMPHGESRQDRNDRLADTRATERAQESRPTENRSERIPMPEPRPESRESRIPTSASRHSLDHRVNIPDQRVNLPEQRVNTPDQRVNIPDQRVNVPDHRVNLPERTDRKVNLDSRCENKYEVKPPPRQHSLPTTSSVGTDGPTKSTTLPKFPSEDGRDPPYENLELEARRKDVPVPGPKINPLTHDRHGRKYGDNVSYENINLDYIARLVGEGYPKDIVVRALGITRNDIEMACDILHEFGSKMPQV